MDDVLGRWACVTVELMFHNNNMRVKMASLGKNFPSLCLFIFKYVDRILCSIMLLV